MTKSEKNKTEKAKSKKMQVLFAAFECVPFYKSGGLGDVAGSLPRYINNGSCEVRVILPKLSAIPGQYSSRMEFIKSFDVYLGWRKQYCGLFRLRHNGLTYYFLDNEYYFKRSQVYGEFDDGERVAFFSKAVLEAILHMDGFAPDILHCNDWHTALAPVFLREMYMQSEKHRNIRTVFTIHNLKFQGQYSRPVLDDILGLKGTPAEAQMCADDSVNYMAGGVHYTDWITTVSPSYADEITGEYYGEKLDPLFRERKPVMTGILNGIDYKEYDPAKDRLIAANYDAQSIEAKKINKLALQRELGLEENADTALIILISRLTEQKGLDLVNYILPQLAGRDMQFAVLGVGDRKYEEAFSRSASEHPDKFKTMLCFSEELSHRFYAGADALLMPSRFEPCGLSQMMAMRYGTLPIVRETGGLKDSVRPYNKYTKEGTGFSFANFNADELLSCIDLCLDTYYNSKEDWSTLVQNAMKEDFSWSKAANTYRALYRRLKK